MVSQSTNPRGEITHSADGSHADDRTICVTISPKEFQTELDLPRGRRSAGAGPDCSGHSAWMCSCWWRKHDQIRRVEIGAVQEIENLRAELKTEAFCDGGVLEHGKIPCGKSRAGDDVAAGVAVKTACRRRSNEGGGIKPLPGIAQHNGPSEVRIDEGANRIARVAIVGRVVAELRSERETCLEGDDAGERPPADQGARPAGDVARVALATAEW